MSELVKRVHEEFANPRIVRAIGWFVGVGGLCYLGVVFWSGWRETVGAFERVTPQAIFLGALIASTAYLWRFGRWEYSLRCLGYAVPRGRHLCIYLSGLALTATPGKAGETFRSALLLQQGVRVQHSLAAFLADRASDVLGMCVLGAIASTLVGKSTSWAWGVAFLLLTMGSCGVSYVLWHPPTNTGSGRLGGFLRVLPVRVGKDLLVSWSKVWTLRRVVVFFCGRAACLWNTGSGICLVLQRCGNRGGGG